MTKKPSIYNRLAVWLVILCAAGILVAPFAFLFGAQNLLNACKVLSILFVPAFGVAYVIERAESERERRLTKYRGGRHG